MPLSYVATVVGPTNQRLKAQGWMWAEMEYLENEQLWRGSTVSIQTVC